MMTAAMPPAISPYSIAVAPSSSAAKAAAREVKLVQSRAISVMIPLSAPVLQQRRQMRDQRQVGGGHGVVAQLVRLDPLELLAFGRRAHPLPAPAHVERHQQVKVLVGVAREGERRKARLPDDDPEFPLELAYECLLGTLARLD